MKNALVVLIAVGFGFVGGTETQELNKHDRTRIMVQDICPVCGTKLASEAKPVKVKVGEELVYVCSNNCGRGPIREGHWATIHSNFARAQRTCPVMKKPLPAKAKWTILKGQIVYVCCPPCIEKVAAEPQVTLQFVQARYDDSVRAGKK